MCTTQGITQENGMLYARVMSHLGSRLLSFHVRTVKLNTLEARLRCRAVHSVIHARRN